MSEVFARTHTQKEDRLWVDKRSEDVNEVQSPPPPPIDEDEVWARIAGGHKRGRIYGMGVVPSHKYPHVFADPDDDDTASSPPDLREQVTLFNRKISQQAEAHAQRVAAVEAVCAKKTKSQEISDLKKAYSDIYSFLTQMGSSGSSSAAMPDMPPHRPPA
ncbi:hypothetical protein PIB30_027873 [Stylosanthes scabra]|uniref:Uncharacterized protein n=1 Tax=Stylosanthes scabra TaxID=79078 RepID=A0ABU6WAF1_9FABA|nr:hypothetical protein [Stylosanthes scabra]